MLNINAQLHKACWLMAMQPLPRTVRQNCFKTGVMLSKCNAKVVSETLAATLHGQPNMLLLCCTWAKVTEDMQGRLTR